MRVMVIVLAGAFFVSGGMLPARGQATVGTLKGVWLTENDESKIQLTDCGPTRPESACGKIVWLKEPNDEKGRPLVDDKNEIASLRSRPILGLTLFDGLRPAGNGQWSGRIYNPDDGGSYEVTLWQSDPNILQVKGCLLFMCQTQSWRRAGP